jgi:dihydrofolate reductase
VARGDLADEISRLRQEPGGDILAWGGASFVQALSRAGLVDEYRLTINPVALGDGLPLFKGLAAPIALQLVEATTYGNGAAVHIYRPV